MYRSYFIGFYQCYSVGLKLDYTCCYHFGLFCLLNMNAGYLPGYCPFQHKVPINTISIWRHFKVLPEVNKRLFRVVGK